MIARNITCFFFMYYKLSIAHHCKASHCIVAIQIDSKQTHFEHVRDVLANTIFLSMILEFHYSRSQHLV